MMDRRRMGGGLGTLSHPRPRREVVPELPDAEWEEFIADVKDPNKASKALISQFVLTSKEQGQCVSYLRKLLNRVFKYLKEDPESDEKPEYTILQTLFKLTLRSWSIPENVLGDLLSLGMTEVRNFSSAALSGIILNHSMKYIKDNPSKDLPVGWIDMFGKIVTALTTKGDIPHEGDIIDGKEFRKYIVSEICRMDWSQQIVTSLIKILEEIPGIEASEVDIILDKLGSSLKTMKAAAIPIVMNKLVTLTGNFRPARLFKTCDDYFGSAQLLLKGDGFENLDKVAKRKALAMVAFHFVDASRHCNPIVREVLKLVKASVYDHILVMTPFALSVVLGMTSVDYLRSEIVEPLKNAIMKSFHDLNLSEASKWYRNTRGVVSNEIRECFEAVLQMKSNALEYMSDGLVILGVGLLGADTLQWKYPMTSKPCIELGQFLITSVVKSNKAYVGVVMNQLLSKKKPPHIECLAACFSMSSRIVGHRDFNGRIHELMQHLPAMSVEAVSVIVKSLIPALRMSPELLNELMIVLRKTLWKSTQASSICVETICVILSKCLVRTSVAYSEICEGSDDLIYSQLSQGTSAQTGQGTDFEPLCVEILGMAKRFFQLGCPCRQQLYLGFHRVARSNPYLTEIICGQLFTHASQYIKVVPLKEVTIDCITFKSLFCFGHPISSNVIVQDELGFLVQCIGFVIIKADSLSVKTASYRSCREMLENWIIYSSKVNIDLLEITASSILGDAPGSPKPLELARFVKEVLVIQTMQVIAALIEYLAQATCLCEDSLSCKKPLHNPDKIVMKLFRKYQELEKVLKEIPASKKTILSEKTKGSKKKKKADSEEKSISNSKRRKVDTDTETTCGTPSVASEFGSCSSSAKFKKTYEVPKVEYYHLINLDSVCLMLREVYGVSTHNNRALKSLKELETFEAILLNTVKQKVALLKAKVSIRERQRAPEDTLNVLTLIVSIIWKRMCSMVNILKNTEVLAESMDIVETRLEVISEIVEFFYNEGHIYRVLDFNNSEKIQHGVQDKYAEARNQLSFELFEEWKLVLELVTNGFDGAQGNANPLLFTILNFVCQVMPPLDMLQTICSWTWQYLKKDDSSIDGTLDLLKTVVALFSTCTGKCSAFPINKGNDILRLCKAVRIVVGDVNGDAVEQREPSWLITKDTAPALVTAISAFVERQLGMVSSILGRLRAHGQYLGEEKCSEMREKCYEMMHCIRSVSTELIRTAFPAGPWFTDLLRMIPQIYVVMSNFAEYLLDLCKKKTECDLDSFKTLVAVFGTDFKANIETMINHSEHVQRLKLDYLETTKKGKNASKVPAAFKTQISKDSKLYPNLVYDIEKFERNVIMLSNKAHVDILVGLKLSTARDFRIETTTFDKVIGDQTKAAVSLQQEDETQKKRGRKKKQT